LPLCCFLGILGQPLRERDPNSGKVSEIMNDKMSKGRSLIPIERIEQSILLIRGKKVMLDRDLARLYGVETRVLNQAVRRNIDRFPQDFIFHLTREEIMRISQFVISSCYGVRTLKFSKSVMAFTEHGVAMLSSV